MGKNRKIDMVILGLLCHKPLTGYDIKKRIDNSIRFFWKGSFGSIYPALGGMEQEGLVTKNANFDKSTGRERIEYIITDSGRKVVEEWLEDSKASNELMYETLLKLFFGGIAEKQVTIRNIELFRENIEEELELLKFYQENLSKSLEGNDHKYYYLTVLFGIKSYEAYLQWCDEAVEMLE